MLFTAVGPLCELSDTAQSEGIRQSCGSYDDYISNLSSTCQGGDPGELVWTPDDSTPDLVYYQVKIILYTTVAVE